ncbi:MAG: TipAS antibiotic-recognition domain-containing protein, partial [Candidatus Sericytochromatia bacterium]
FTGMDKQTIEKHKEKYAQEVEERWGQTEAYQQSQQKTAHYTAQDWERIQARTADIYAKIVAGMSRGPADPDVQAAVADLRQSFCDYYYDCTPEIFKGLGEMYVADERFTAFYEKIQPGLAAFLSQAIAIYCEPLPE